MSGTRDTSADAVLPAGESPPSRAVIPWPLGFSPLLFLGDLVRFLARSANRDILS